MVTKQGIRREILAKRTQMPKEVWQAKSDAIFQKVAAHPSFLCASVICCYVDYKQEVDTHRIIAHAWSQQKQVAVPRIDGGKMDFYLIQSMEELEAGYCGILEPKKTAIPVEAKEALVLLPLVAFDSDRSRIGYGKGFYDEFLSRHPNFDTMGLGFQLQCVPAIPRESHDRCPKYIITEEQIYD